MVPDSPLSRFPFKDIAWNALAFGFLPEDDDYVVVHIVKPSSTAAPDSSDDDEDMCTDELVFVDGTAFWVGYNSNELYQVLNPKILPFGQSIAYFVEVDQKDVNAYHDEYNSPHLDIWVLKDNMLGEFSWEKKMSVGLSEDVLADVLGTRNNGEPILAKSNNLISYDLDTHKPYDFVESCERLTPNFYYDEGSYLPLVISPFVETLVLLDID
ncbi:hypothetical protein ACET3Z_000771 [Daucus carota]